MYINRSIEPAVRKISETFSVLMVTGPRQVGKTTLLEKMSGEDRKRITLDDPDVRWLAKRDPGLFMQRYEPPVLIDEIQYAPELFPYIKMAVDQSGRNGDFWLTGSQSFQMMKDISESLAGRVGIIQLQGLATNEIMGVPARAFSTEPHMLMDRIKEVESISLEKIYERICRGSMPKLYSDPTVETEAYYRSYIDTYLKRDIRDLSQVADESTFYQFMTVVAARTAKPVIYEEIAKECGISAPTAKKWLSILQSSNIIVLVQPYHHNHLKRVTKMPLLHFLDTGLCAYLLRWNSPEALERGAMSGPFFESYVFSEIYKSFLNAGKEPPLYYYRDKEKREIDLLIEENGTLFPIEIKKTASPYKDSVRHFKVLEPLAEPEKFSDSNWTKLNIGNGAVICLGKDLLPLDRKNWVVPVWMI